MFTVLNRFFFVKNYYDNNDIIKDHYRGVSRKQTVTFAFIISIRVFNNIITHSYYIKGAPEVIEAAPGYI